MKHLNFKVFPYEILHRSGSSFKYQFGDYQGWQVVAKSGFNHWFLPVKTSWQKVGKNKINLIIKIFVILV